VEYLFKTRSVNLTKTRCYTTVGSHAMTSLSCTPAVIQLSFLDNAQRTVAEGKCSLRVRATQQYKNVRKLVFWGKIWGFDGSDYEECCLLGYKPPVRTSQETHYFSSTESSLLMLFMIWGFHGSDYEECRLLGYKPPVLTSQETHYVSATQSSQIMLCKIWGFRGSEYEEWRLLGC
jgi:hypothetical protein